METQLMALKRLTALLLSPLTLLLIAFMPPAQAQLTLTPTAVSAGYKLTTVATGFPYDSNRIGPIGVAFTDAGTLLVTEPRFNAVNILPNDTDNQIAGSNTGVSYMEYGLVKVGSITYAATTSGVIQINQDGSYKQTIVSGIVSVGIVVNPVNGHLLVSDDNSLVYDIDPIAKTHSFFASGLNGPDGLTITADGSTLYEADFYSGNIYAFDTSTKAKTLVASGLNLADGISLGYGSIANKLFVNCGTGNVYQIDIVNNNAVTLIASGGSRGDFVVPDANGTLLLTQTDRILRLTAPPPGGSFLPDGRIPSSGLIKSTDGSFYGVTARGGAFDQGTVYKTDVTGRVSILYSFASLDSSLHNANGAHPSGNLVQGSDGLFYGATTLGGASGNGTIYKIANTGAFTVLHTFTALNSNSQNTDGAAPQALVQSADGNFYGVTAKGGSFGSGTIYKITSTGTFALFHSFSTSVTGTGTASDPFTAIPNADGGVPNGPLVIGKDGAFYGTARTGGTSTAGTAFKITSSGTFTTLHSFGTVDSSDGSGSNLDGYAPLAGLIQGVDGAFYGTTYFGGVYDNGTIFKINSTGTFTALYSFSYSFGQPNPTNLDGARPEAALTQGIDGAFYGTAFRGGVNGSGAVFKLTLSGVFTTLYSFPAAVPNNYVGGGPAASLLQDSSGLFYGTTGYGGASRGGTLFSIDSVGNYTTIHNFTGN